MRVFKCKEHSKKNELNIMVEYIDPHIIGITESRANVDITDAELGLRRYVMFKRDWCKIISRTSTLTIGLVYRSPNTNAEDNTKIQKEVSKGNVSQRVILTTDTYNGNL